MTHGCYSAALLSQSILMTEMHFKTLELTLCLCCPDECKWLHSNLRATWDTMGVKLTLGQLRVKMFINFDTSMRIVSSTGTFLLSVVGR